MSSAGPELDLLAAIESATADRRILEFAARGFVPLAPPDLARAVASILAGGDPELSALAEETFRGFDTATLVEAGGSEGVRPEQLDAVARRSKDGKVLERLIQSRSVPIDTLTWLASRVPPELQDVLITNQVRLLESPVILEQLFENPHLSADIKRRADEFLEEFFLKKEREEMAREAEAAKAAKAAAEAAELQEAVEEAEEEGGEVEPAGEPLTEEQELGLVARIALMTVVQRIRLAFRGNREERLFLIRDNNRLVSTAVLKSPKTRDGDAEAIAGMKNVSEDVLRAIAQRRDWVRKYGIMAALVKNPRSPIDATLNLVPRLTARDQKLLASDRNVPEAIRATARRLVAKRES